VYYVKCRSYHNHICMTAGSTQLVRIFVQWLCSAEGRFKLLFTQSLPYSQTTINNGKLFARAQGTGPMPWELHIASSRHGLRRDWAQFSRAKLRTHQRISTQITLGGVCPSTNSSTIYTKTTTKGINSVRWVTAPP